MTGYMNRRRARRAPAPPPLLTQDELRTMRRRRAVVEYDQRFDLAEEVNALCTPLAARVVALGRQVHLAQPEVEALARVTHRAISDLIRQHGVIVAGTRTQHLAESERMAAKRALLDAIDVDPPPVVNTDSLRSGAWAAELVRQATSIRTEVARYLQPGVLVTTGRGPTWSERVTVALRPVDLASTNLHKRLSTLARAARDRADKASRTAQRRPETRHSSCWRSWGSNPSKGARHEGHTEAVDRTSVGAHRNS